MLRLNPLLVHVHDECDIMLQRFTSVPGFEDHMNVETLS